MKGVRTCQHVHMQSPGTHPPKGLLLMPRTTLIKSFLPPPTTAFAHTSTAQTPLPVGRPEGVCRRPREISPAALAKRCDLPHETPRMARYGVAAGGDK